ncbi:maleate cis-trans isomerase [Agaricicola taiwanensis]|uniref:Maleate cis-trans isomerase n=1 Tax=Agaricicola taiwanensis TaxID=591372 RepID=A0A8J2YFA2_9RHOB|nr:aspartate/glutamate racemase family protein [Agaricicola taiwanensis]GGE31287.1 maleate cis-trans isomerase [Agaricicola taiwanensis]
MGEAPIRRFGVLFPPGNVAMERELPPLLPEEVAMHCNRLSRPDSSLSEASLLAMEASVDRAASDLAQTQPEVIVYGCTSGSFLGEDDGAIARKITALTGIPAVTTATSVWQAMRALAMARVYMITPYPDELNRQEADFLRHHGIEVAAWDSFQCRNSEEIRRVPSREVSTLAMSHAREISACDGLFISCTQLHTLDQIERLERELNVPVVTSNQASLWAALTRMKIDVTGISAGRLFKAAA